MVKHGIKQGLVINGWIQQAKGRSYAPRSKRSPYEGGIRTPILFRWPAKMKAVDRPELCSSIDIAPTILAAVGAEIPKGGRSWG